MEQVVWNTIMQPLWDSWGMRPSQHGLIKGKSCLTNLISFYIQVTLLVDERKAIDVVYLDFSKAFDTLSHCILLEKLAVHGLDRYTGLKTVWTARPREVVVNRVKSSQ